MRFAIALILGAITAFASPVLAADEHTDCDRLAASPVDPGRKADGVEFNDIDGKAAEAACRAAIADSADVPRFMFQLGRALDRQDRFEEAKAAYQAAFEAGYVVAYQAYGKLFELGLGGDVDYKKAAEYYQRAIDAGMKFASGDLAYLHEEGLGFDKDPAAAAPLYRVAAEAGDAWSQVHLGFLYETGSGVAQDYAEAVKWYTEAARQGDAFGQFDLGVMYENGHGVEKDASQAFRLFRLAAEQGNALAMREMARFFRYGISVNKDDAEAERLWRKAIAEGNGDAVFKSQNELAWMFATENRNLGEAQSLVEEALAKIPEGHKDRATTLDTAAWIAHLRGDNDKALKSLQEAVTLDPNFAPYHDRLGDIYAALGRTDDAKAEWHKALTLANPDDTREPDWDGGAVEQKLKKAG